MLLNLEKLPKSAPKPNVVVRVGRSIVQIQSKTPCIRTIVPVPRTETRCLSLIPNFYSLRILTNRLTF